MKNNYSDLSGQVFGRLTVICRVENDKKNNSRWKCICDCGNECTVLGVNLRNGGTKSCGCLAKELAIKRNKKQNIYDLDSCEYGVGYDYNGNKFYFDKEDYDLISEYCWHSDSKGYIVTVRPKNIRMHRLVMKIEGNDIIDHINLNKADNRKENLRIVTNSQNRMNTRIPICNTSGTKGVCYVKSRDKWCAYISVNKKRITLGRYNNIEDAIAAREAAEKLYFGEYNYSIEKDHLFNK